MKSYRNETSLLRSRSVLLTCVLPFSFFFLVFSAPFPSSSLLRSRSVLLRRVLPFSFYFSVLREWGRKDQKEKRKRKNTSQKNRTAAKETRMKLDPVSCKDPCKRTQHCWTITRNIGPNMLRPFAWNHNNVGTCCV